MTATAPALRLIVSPSHGDRPRQVAALAACAAVDALAVGILLVGTPLPLPLEGVAAAVSHGTAVILLSGLARGRPSRQWLCVGAALAVPLIGTAVAAAILATRGRAWTPRRRRGGAHRRPALALVEMKRLGGALSPCDALERGDEEQRGAALRALSRRDDPEAIALLRRVAAGPEPDLALFAALVLDEIGERAERRSRPEAPPGARHVEA